jgi:hypothetical protein
MDTFNYDSKEAREGLTHCFAANLSEYGDKIGPRGLASVQAIPDEEFEQGLASLRANRAAHDAAQPVVEEADPCIFSSEARPSFGSSGIRSLFGAGRDLGA